MASPPLVVAYALAGTVDIDLENDPIGKDKDGNDVYFKDIWPTSEEVEEVVKVQLHLNYSVKNMRRVSRKRAMECNRNTDDSLYDCDENSTYIPKPTIL